MLRVHLAVEMGGFGVRFRIEFSIVDQSLTRSLLPNFGHRKRDSIIEDSKNSSHYCRRINPNCLAEILLTLNFLKLGPYIEGS